MNEYLQNYFYGLANHYNHPGWYFDVVTDEIDDLTNSRMDDSILAVRPGRFVLERDYGAVFMRTDGNYMFIIPFTSPSGSFRYYYQDKYHLNGLPTGNISSTEDQDLGDWLIAQGVPQDEVDDLINSGTLEITSGFQFISYTSPNVQIWQGGTAQIVTDFGNTDYTVTDDLASVQEIFSEQVVQEEQTE